MQFLKDLQREYRTILDYRSTLQGFAIAAVKMHGVPRRNEVVTDKRRRQTKEVIAVEKTVATKKVRGLRAAAVAAS